MLGKSMLMRGAVALLIALTVLVAGTDGADAARRRRTKVPAVGYAPRVAEDTYVMNGNFLLWDVPIAQRPAHLKAVAATGTTAIRREAVWHEVEPLPPTDGVHRWKWGGYDAFVREMAAVGLRWQPVLGYSTLWASSLPWQGWVSQFYPPSNDADFAAYAAAFAARYGRGGRFWSENPSLAARPVTTYEIWNEQNASGFWKPVPDPARYASLFAAARDAILAIDPSATVIIGGMARAPWTGGGYHKDTDFVRDMYQARPELRGTVAGVGYHPYSGTLAGRVTEVLANVRNLRAALDGPQTADPGMPIYVTEIGWPTGGSYPPEIPILTETQRAAAMKTVADQLPRSNCGVRQVAPHTWISPENGVYNGLPLTSIQRWFGIANPDTTLKRTGVAFADVVRRNRGLTSTSPDYSTVDLCPT